MIDGAPGEYPVRVTVADVSEEQDGSHEREAYLSLVIADGATVAVELAHKNAHWYSDLFETDTDDDDWFSRMDDPAHLREGCADIVMPLAEAGENVILSHSGWGDGLFPVLRTRDGQGHLLGLHIDLHVAGDDDPPARAAKGKLRRLFGG